jgi:hypothetical protein
LTKRRNCRHTRPMAVLPSKDSVDGGVDKGPHLGRAHLAGASDGDLTAARHHAGIGQERPRLARRLLQLAQRRAEGAVQPDRPPADRQKELKLRLGGNHRPVCHVPEGDIPADPPPPCARDIRAGRRRPRDRLLPLLNASEDVRITDAGWLGFPFYPADTGQSAAARIPRVTPQPPL